MPDVLKICTSVNMVSAEHSGCGFQIMFEYLPIIKIKEDMNYFFIIILVQ